MKRMQCLRRFENKKRKKRKALCLILGFVIALSALILPAAAAGNNADFSGGKTPEEIVSEVHDIKGVQSKFEEAIKGSDGVVFFSKPDEYIVVNLIKWGYFNNFYKSLSRGKGIESISDFAKPYAYVPVYVSIDGDERIVGGMMISYNAEQKCYTEKVVTGINKWDDREKLKDSVFDVIARYKESSLLTDGNYTVINLQGPNSHSAYAPDHSVFILVQTADGLSVVDCFGGFDYRQTGEKLYDDYKEYFEMRVEYEHSRNKEESDFLFGWLADILIKILGLILLFVVLPIVIVVVVVKKLIKRRLKRRNNKMDPDAA